MMLESYYLQREQFVELFPVYYGWWPSLDNIIDSCSVLKWINIVLEICSSLVIDFNKYYEL